MNDWKKDFISPGVHLTIYGSLLQTIVILLTITDRDFSYDHIKATCPNSSAWVYLLVMLPIVWVLSIYFCITHYGMIYVDNEMRNGRQYRVKRNATYYQLLLLTIYYWYQISSLINTINNKDCLKDIRIITLDAQRRCSHTDECHWDFQEGEWSQNREVQSFYAIAFTIQVISLFHGIVYLPIMYRYVAFNKRLLNSGVRPMNENTPLAALAVPIANPQQDV